MSGRTVSPPHYYRVDLYRVYVQFTRMSISTRRIPPGTKITIWAEPVIGQLGLEALSPRLASVFARWSALEKQLNQLLTLVTDADPSARVQFDDLKGWDRRADYIVNEARARLSTEIADLVKIILRLAKIPAGKRDELAHRVWAIAEGFEMELALLPADDQHSFAENIVAVKKAGRCDIPLDNGSLYSGSSLVSAADIDELIYELTNAQDRMDCLIRGHLWPPFADATGDGFANYRNILANDSEVSLRLNNIENERRRVQRIDRRQLSG